MRYFRKVIRIAAQDVPNVRDAERLLRGDPGMSIEELERLATTVPGVLTWSDYRERRATWGPMEQTICLDALFYRGAQVMLFPDEWLDRASTLRAGAEWRGMGARNCLGVDPAEGGDNTAWAVVNKAGLVELVSKKTSDTADVPGETLAIMREFRVSDGDCGFDRGGGGKIHADILRRRGHNVRTVAFGDPAFSDPERGMKTFGERVDVKEDRYVFRNLRAQMYFELSLDSNFAMPARLLDRKRITGSHSLRYQLSKMPRLLDEDGCYWLPSKGNQTEEMKRRNIKTLTQILGCSPDEADAVVIAHHLLQHPHRRMQAGAA